MALRLKENISWVGKVDWGLRTFHGKEFSTHRGTSYKSYLVREANTERRLEASEGVSETITVTYYDLTCSTKHRTN